MNINFTDIGLTPDVTLINVIKMSAKTKDVFYLFDCLAKAGIDVDMISQPASPGAHIPLSFTVSDSSLADVITVLGALKKTYPEIRTDVNPSNIKVHFTSESMIDSPGVAAGVIGAFADADVDIKMISTSEIDISLLIDRSQHETALSVLKDRFGKTF